MEINDSGEFGRRLIALAEVFDVKLSQARAALYFEAIRDMPFATVADALNAAVKTCRFFPKPAELRTLALGDSEDATEVAWVAFKQAMPRLGYMASVSVHDAALGEAILALFGSWSGACTAELSPEMWASKRKEFGRVYRVMRQRNLDGGRYLIGTAEQQNSGIKRWMEFVPMGCIGRDGAVRRLTAAEGEQERERLAVESHEFSRIGGSQTMQRLIDSHSDGGDV